MWRGHCFCVFVAVVGVLALRETASGAGEAPPKPAGSRTNGFRNGDVGRETERLPAPKPPPPPTAGSPQRTPDAEGQSAPVFPRQSWSTRPGMSAATGRPEQDEEPEQREGEEGQCIAEDAVTTTCCIYVA